MTVLDLSSVGPAARATRLLADYGATVVKVGAVPGRGPARVTPPVLRLQRPAGACAASSSTSAIPTASRPSWPWRPGPTWWSRASVPASSTGWASATRTLRAVNAGIIYCSTSGYGQDGPRSAWAGHDLNYLAVSGYLATLRTRGPTGDHPSPGPPSPTPPPAGMQAALAISAALFARQHTGEGTFLDVSVADGALWLMSLAVDEHLAIGTEPGPGHDVLTGRYACYDTYRAADGRWLAVAAIEAKFFANLCRALGCEQWIERQYDDDAQDEIRAALAAAFASADRDTWVASPGRRRHLRGPGPGGLGDRPRSPVHRPGGGGRGQGHRRPVLLSGGRRSWPGCRRCRPR